MSLYDQLKNSQNPIGEFSKMLDRLTISNNLLMNVMLELTPVCNFRCPFCYARVSPEELKRRNIQVMDFEGWKRYIDEFAQMNAMILSFTGGECTLHPDFCRLYRYAYEKGFTVNVFTNGSHITDEILEMFSQMPPYRVFLTLYGNCPETYETVTGNAKFHDLVKANVEKLVARKIDVVLQATLSNDNYRDVEGFYAYADSLGVEVRVTNQLTSTGNCTDEVYQEQKVDNEKVTPITMDHWKKKRGITPDQALPKQRIRPVPPNPDAVGIKCNAGKNTCFIRHDGKMLGCNMLDAFTVDTHGRPLTECFAELNNWAKSLQRIKECEGCIHAIHCTTCVAAHYADTKQIGVPSPKRCFKVLQPEKARQEQEFFDKHGYLEV